MTVGRFSKTAEKESDGILKQKRRRRRVGKMNQTQLKNTTFNESLTIARRGKAPNDGQYFDDFNHQKRLLKMR